MMFFVLGLAIGLGLAAALWAFNLAYFLRADDHTSVWWPWAAIAGGLLLFTSWTGVLLYREATGAPGGADSITASLSLAGALLVLLGIHGITRQMRGLLVNRAALFKQVAWLEPAFEDNPLPMAIKDESLVYLQVNKAMVRWLGREPEEFAVRSDIDFLPHHQAKQLQLTSRQALETGKPQVWAGEIQPRQETRFVRSTHIPVGDGDGRVQGVLVVLQDLTEWEQVEAPLREKVRRLETLSGASEELSEATSAQEALEAGLVWACRLVGTENGFAALQDPDQRAPVIIATTPTLKGMQGRSIRPGEGIAGRVWQSGQVRLMNDPLSWENQDSMLAEQGLRASIGTPLQADGQIFGVLALFQSGQGRFDEEAIEGLRRLGERIAQAIVQAERKQATKQSLIETQRALNAAQIRGRVNHLVAALGAHFLQAAPDEIEEGVRRSLQSLAQYVGMDCAYLYLPSKKQRAPAKIYEWTANGKKPPSQALLKLHNSEDGWWMGKLNRLDFIQFSRLEDLPNEARYAVEQLALEDVHSLIAVPVMAGRSLAGYLGLYSLGREQQVVPGLVGLLKLAGEMLVNSLELRQSMLSLAEAQEQSRKRMLELEQRNSERVLLFEMGDLLQACRTAEEAYPIIARYAQGLLPGASGALYLVRNREASADLVAEWGLKPPPETEQEMTLNACWALRRGRIHVVHDSSGGPLCNHIHEPLPDAYLCAPLIAQGETVGLLHVRAHSNNGTQLLPEHQQQLVRMLAEHTALALSNLHLRDKLRSQAIRDPLTGLFNRRYMEATLERELRRAARHRTSVGIIMFDVDRMKPINDTFGHEAGDIVLRGVGELMLKMFRGEDVACRYGGDEFMIVLPEAGLEDIYQRADQLRQAFKNLSLEYEGSTLGPISLSIGVSVFPEHGTNTERLLQVSDEAVYLAKAAGGDRVMLGKVLVEE